LNSILGRVVMRRPIHSAFFRVVNSVVVDMDRHAKDVHGHVGRHDEQKAVNSLALVIKHVVTGTCFNPFTVDLEEKRRQTLLKGTFGQDHARLVSPVVNLSVFKHVTD